MKLIIFTPAIKSSAIGRMACLVTRALVSQGHDVTVVRTEAERLLDTPTHDFGSQLIRWNEVDQVIALARTSDAVVYQVGNNYEFHQGGVEWLANLPGLVCLHDFYLCDLFNGWAQHRRQEAVSMLRNWYGPDIASRFFGYTSSDTFLEGTRNSSPMTEWLCSMAYSVITHSSWGVERVLKSCPGPVYVVPLAYDAPEYQISTPALKYGGRHQFELLTVGHINSNKRIASVIRAIGSSPTLRQATAYRLVGHIQSDTALELSALARKLEVNLFISGEVDDAELALAIQQADVVSCLRWPSLEAASASAIEAMLYGKPIIVTDTGFYAEIPGECAVKINPNNEINDLASALDRLVADSSLRNQIGGAAKQWASKISSAEAYSLQLIACLGDMSKSAPLISAVNNMNNFMFGWSGNIGMLSDADIASVKIIVDRRIPSQS